MSKPDIEEAVRRLDVSDDFKSWAAFTEPDGARIPCLMARAPDLRALIASWRERGEALRLSRPFVNVAASPRQAEASTRWHDKAITALAAIDAALLATGHIPRRT